MTLLLLLGFVADKLRSIDLASQADLLGIAALIRLGFINLQLTSHWGAFSQRGITVALAAILFYLGMRGRTEVRFGPSGYISAAYSWSGSVLLGLLVWYELRPISVAVAWGILGLVLFEIGFFFRRFYFRQQGYGLLAISFVRIFFVNLNIGGNSHLSSPRVIRYFR